MPLVTAVSEADGVRHTVGTGVVTDRDFVDGYAAMVADPGYDPALDHLVDLTAVDRFDVTSLGARELGDLMRLSDALIPDGVRPKVAAVAATDEGITLLWMYRSVREHGGSPVEFGIFRSVGEARSWLGLSPAESAAVNLDRP
jgi:hypothetical protein